MIYRHLKIKIFYTLILSVSCINALDFSKCKEFYINTSKEFAGKSAIHIGNGNYLAYSSIPLEDKSLVKKDDILGLYLFKDSPLKAKYILRNIDKSIPLTAINKNTITKGKILQKQQSFNNLAIFSKNINENSVISDICYQIYGISAGENRFIDKKYIDRFLQTKNAKYSYIGVFVKDSKDGVVVSHTNPLVNTTINPSDIILSVNDKKIIDSNHFTDTVASISPDSNVKLEIKRGSKILQIHIKTLEQNTRFGVNPSFLEVFGLILDEDLVVRENLAKNDFKVGDKILRVNQIKIKTIEELNKSIKNVLMDTNTLSFLIVRDDFELFITLTLQQAN